MTTVRYICEQALSKVGQFSAADDAADPRQMQIAARWFNDLTKHLAATARRQWLIEGSITIPLVAAQDTYSLIRANLSSQRNETLATQQNEALRVDEVPDPGIMFVLRASLRDNATGRTTPLPLIDRLVYDLIEHKQAQGVPTCIHVDQLNEMSMRVHPVPREALWSVVLTVQRLTFDATDQRGRTEIAADIMIGFELWASHALAALIGTGPVTRLPADEVRTLKGDAERYMTELQAFANLEASREAQTVYNDLG